MPARVLVTRPEPAAAGTADRLRAKGYEAVVLPLTRIAPLPVPSDGPFGPVDAVAATSANAIRHAPRELLAALTDKPCLAVGAQTADAARAAGFSRVDTSGGDGAALARLTIGLTRPGAAIAYLCGRVRKSAFEEAVAVSGRRVFPIETYDAAAVHHAHGEAASCLGDRPIDAVLLYSDRAAESFRALIASGAAGDSFAKSVLIGLSSGIGKPLGGSGLRFIAASEPTEDALLRALASTVPAMP